MKFLVLVLAVAVVDLALANSPPGRRAGPPAPPPGTSTPAPVADGGSFSGRHPGPPSGNPSDVRRPFGIPRPPAPPPGNGNGGNGNGGNGNGGNGNGGNGNGGNGNGRDRQADRRDPRPVNPETNLPCSRQNDRLPYPSDCAMYYVCNHRRLMKMPCAPGTHFNRARKMCDWPSNANCVPTHTTTATPDTCIQGERSAVLDDCTKYYLCHRGELMRRSCPPGTEFSAATKSCLHASSANCRRILDSPADPDEDCKDQDTIYVRRGPEGRLLAFQCKPNFGYFPLMVNCTRPTSCSFPVAAEPIGENPISTRIVKDLPPSLP